MKTAISVPADTFERATQRATDLGMSRSEFFTRAARHYLAELDTQSLTGRIDNAIDHLGPVDEAAAGAIAAAHHLLAAATDEW
ncbi:MAG: ribbon-helix-helix domain-containing protein [Nocardioides sp.]